MLLLSYTSMELFDKCGYCFWLNSIARYHPPVPIDTTGVVPGKICHKLAELFFKSGGKDWEVFYKLFDATFDHYISKPSVVLGTKNAFAKDINGARKYCLRCRDNLVEELHSPSFAGPFFVSEGVIGVVESPFEIIPGVGIIGGWDLLCGKSSDSPLFLVDFKASDSDYYLSGKQLDVYALCIERKFGWTVHNTAYLLFKKKTNRLITYSFGDDNRARALDWINRCKVRADIQQYQPTPSKFACRLCQFRTECKYKFVEPIHESEGPIAFIPQAF